MIQNSIERIAAMKLVDKGYARNTQEGIDMVEDIFDNLELAFDDGKTFDEAKMKLKDMGYKDEAISIVIDEWDMREWSWGEADE